MVNLILLPESFISGMAGSKRVGNFIPYLSKIYNYKLTNIVLSPKSNRVTPSLANEIKIINLGNINPFLQIFKINKTITALFNKQYKNIIYYYGYPDIFNVLYLLRAKRLGYKIVLDIVENNFVLNKFNSYKTKLRIVSSRSLFNHLNKIAHGIICISSQLENMIRKVVGPLLPVLLIPVTIIKENFPESQLQSEIKKKIRFFYGGSFGVKDGLNFFLDSFNIIADKYDVELYISGIGNQKDENKVKKYIRGLKNKDKIKWLGFLSDQEYYDMINSADIHCMTRIRSEFANQGFPFKLGEMLATGKPVIAARIGDVDKYLNNNNNAILIEPESVSAIVNAIDFLITSPQTAKIIGEAGRKCSFEIFGADYQTKRLYDFLEDL